MAIGPDSRCRMNYYYYYFFFMPSVVKVPEG